MRGKGRTRDAPLAAINIFIFCAAPAIALPTVKNPILASINGCLPKILLSPPLAGMNAAEARPYAELIQMKSAPPMSLTIMGRAVPTEVSSRAERKTDMPVATV